jgi:hypothetical protein
MAKTDEQNEAYITALLEEKRMHPERATDINKELRRVGHQGAEPAKRAEKRPAGQAAKEKR